MSTNRSRRIDRDVAEQLLGGEAVGTVGGPGALSRMLAAAAAPATERELAGEEAAVAAFREAARLAPTRSSVPPRRSRPMAECVPARPRVAARFLGARAAVAALAVTALGGVAVAAGTGHLPAVLGGESPNLSSQNTAASGSAGAQPGRGHLGASTAPRPGGPAADRTQPGRPPASAQPTDGDSNSPSGDPSAQPAGSTGAALLALCKAWPQDGQQGDSDSRFEPLTRAAGGSNRVRAFCADLARRSPDPGGPTAPAPAAASPTDGDRKGPPGHQGGDSGGPGSTHGKPGPPSQDPGGDAGEHGGNGGGNGHSRPGQDPGQNQSQPAGGHGRQ
ncbi:hypothetical protein LN042_00275 [Kitasatospora sp. RB6PN24]|uniref:hypothetical protein n=1 Tax=Kitasatospora humi TaxID=2893891 RepID=UPI001E522550|nr:hypothetical protein [Kitasatospora humi]MCC9305565.1 hypothetical protein [Kitasatospora humi]